MRYLIGQLLGAVGILAGIALLAGVEWAITAGGAVLLAVSTLAELGRRPARPRTED